MKYQDDYYSPRESANGGSNLGGFAVLLVMIGAFFLLWPQYEKPPETTAFNKCIWTAADQTCLATSLIDKGGRYLNRNDVSFASVKDWKAIDPAAAKLSPEFFDPLALTADEKIELAGLWKKWQAGDHLDFAAMLEGKDAAPLLSLLKR